MQVSNCRRQRVGGRNDCLKTPYVNGGELIISADLGSSSSYSNEVHAGPQRPKHAVCPRSSLEVRSGKGFLASGAQARVSRS